jgi:hypothetical protein
MNVLAPAFWRTPQKDLIWVQAMFSSRASRALSTQRRADEAPRSCYRLRFRTADALSLVSRTIWFDPRTIMLITPEMEYSLLKNVPEYLLGPTWRTVAVWAALPEAVAQVAFTV